MNHDDALRLSATERYLLQDLDEDLRDQFEEHFFECAECATDVRTAAAMLDQIKIELGKAQESEASEKARLRVMPLPERKTPFLLRPVWAAGAIAAMLLVIGYQNIVQVPHLKTEVASMNSIEILPQVSLVNANSRADKLVSAAVSRHKAVLLAVDIPSEDRFSGYKISLYTPEGKPDGSVAVTAEQAKDTVTIKVPAGDVQLGTNTLVIEGIVPGSSPVEVERKPFLMVDSGN
jgi:anti-sigma factor RsiW